MVSEHKPTPKEFFFLCFVLFLLLANQVSKIKYPYINKKKRSPDMRCIGLICSIEEYNRDSLKILQKNEHRRFSFLLALWSCIKVRAIEITFKLSQYPTGKMLVPRYLNASQPLKLQCLVVAIILSNLKEVCS